VSTSKAENESAKGPSAAATLDPAMTALIDDLLDGVLEGKNREDAVERIERDPVARREYYSLRGAVEAARIPVESPDFSMAISREVMFRSASENVFVIGRKQSPWAVPAMVAAGIILAAGVGILMFGPGSQSVLPAQPEGGSPVAVEPAPKVEREPKTQPVLADRGSSTPKRDTSLSAGSMDHHSIAGNWGTELPSEVPGTQHGKTTVIASSVPAHIDTEIAPGRVVSVRVGPSWSLWWIPREGGEHTAESWRLLTRLANPSVNANVKKNEGVVEEK
jgi:hypothetical protein